MKVFCLAQLIARQKSMPQSIGFFILVNGEGKGSQLLQLTKDASKLPKAVV